MQLTLLPREKIFTHQVRVLRDHCVLSLALATNVFKQYTTSRPLVLAAEITRASSLKPLDKSTLISTASAVSNLIIDLVMVTLTVFGYELKL